MKGNLFSVIYLNYSGTVPDLVIAYIPITLMIVLKFDEV